MAHPIIPWIGGKRGLAGKAVLSINDHPDVRRCFAGFQIEEVPITYQVAGGGKDSGTMLHLVLSEAQLHPAHGAAAHAKHGGQIKC